MYTETVLLESRTLRSDVSHRVEVLDKVKALELSGDGVHATTQEVADYFEVGESVVNNLLDRHREELKENGLRILRGADLREYENLKMRLPSANANSYPQRRSQLAVYTRRTVLNVAMLLRDSGVARRVRAYLLDAEEAGRSAAAASACASAAGTVAGLAEAVEDVAALERRVTHVESAVGDIGTVLRELGPVIGRMSVRLERVDSRLEEMDRRLTNTDRVVGAMSHRLADMGEDMRRMRGDLNEVMRDRRSRRHRG